MTKAKKIVILLGDILILYGALTLTLIFRYGQSHFGESFYAHIKPFSLIFLIWLITFYLADLYKEKCLRIGLVMIRAFILALIVNVISSIILFYLFPLFFQLTPKTNLAIFALIFGILDITWRFILVKIYISGGLKNRLLIIGDSPIISEVINYLKTNPQIGYDVAAQIKESFGQGAEESINQIIAKEKIDTIVLRPQLKKELKFAKIFYQLLTSKISVIDLITFYEIIFKKLPLDELEESWFIEKVSLRRHFYDVVKRTIDVFFSLLLSLILLPLMLIITILIKLTSNGPIVLKQKRIGENEKKFTLYKFRTMKIDAERNGAQWATKNDPRVTPVGRLLRRTHLDELPQLLNIIKGDISFVGPRPERPEFVSQLEEKIPYYEIRHLIKPGLTGWAQINYRYGASIEDAHEKLQYDIYYIKNCSLLIDVLILLKTVRLLFITPK